MSATEYIIVSACLLGMRTRYDGRSKPNAALLRKLKGKAVIPVCPEQLGGLPTPRPGAEIEKGDGRDVLAGRARVVNREGKNVTKQYIRGTKEVAKLARKFRVKVAYLKSKSPACGVKAIKRKGRIVKGCGVTSAKLRQMGIKLVEVP